MPLALGAVLRPSRLGAGTGSEPPRLRDAWVATEAPGRKWPGPAEGGDPRPNRTVALFYWTWHVGGNTDLGPAHTNEIVRRPPDALNDDNHPVGKEVGRLGGYPGKEPLFGS